MIFGNSFPVSRDRYLSAPPPKPPSPLNTGSQGQGLRSSFQSRFPMAASAKSASVAPAMAVYVAVPSPITVFSTTSGAPGVRGGNSSMVLPAISIIPAPRPPWRS